MKSPRLAQYVKQVGDVVVDVVCPYCGKHQLAVHDTKTECIAFDCRRVFKAPTHPIGTKYVDAACEACGVIGPCTKTRSGRLCGGCRS